MLSVRSDNCREEDDRQDYSASCNATEDQERVQARVGTRSLQPYRKGRNRYKIAEKRVWKGYRLEKSYWIIHYFFVTLYVFSGGRTGSVKALD